MRRGDVSITEDELMLIVEDEFDQIIELAKYNSFCSNYTGKTKVEMVEYKIFLNEWMI
jgi:hypothetical protein